MTTWQNTCIACGEKTEGIVLASNCRKCGGMSFVCRIQDAHEDPIKAEYAAIKAGQHFWCETHLSPMPVDKKSPDPRYCQDCYDFLTEEAKNLETRHSKRLPAWVPVFSPVLPMQQGREPVTNDSDAASGVGEDVTATPELANDNKKPLDAVISGMAAAGLSTRAISEQLSMQGVQLSHMSIARHLKRAAG